jgi:hypothetical protein
MINLPGLIRIAFRSAGLQPGISAAQNQPQSKGNQD